MSRNNALRLLSAALLAALSLPLMGSTLIDPDTIKTKETEYATAQVFTGDLVREMTAAAGTYMPTYVDIRCEVRNARVAQIENFRSHEIEQGMHLGVLRSESSRADLSQAELTLARAKEDYALGVEQREEEILRRQAAAQQNADAAAREIELLEIQRLELSLEDYRLRQERSIADMEERLQELREQLEDVEVVAPVSGRVSYFSYVSEGESVPYNSVILTLQTDDPTLIRIEDEHGSWRYGMECTVEYGTRTNKKTVPGRVVSADNVLGLTEGTGYAYVQLEEPVDPEELTQITVRGEQFRVNGVLLIPKKAAHLSRGQQLVSILEDDSIANRYVRTALDNTDYTWVLQGLSEGQTLILD
ncbi:MAG: hypothetical protein Q4A66_03650 [Eubacteriales bacterium]|nr:hypothetical protein [Eubacteriales bacterium]